jgi:hypothetical protein
MAYSLYPLSENIPHLNPEYGSKNNIDKKTAEEQASAAEKS